MENIDQELQADRLINWCRDMELLKKEGDQINLTSFGDIIHAILHKVKHT